MEDDISYGLILTAIEMGEAMTEAGAISAVAAFFRQRMDACAWSEEAPSPFFSSAPGAPPLLRFPLHPTDINAECETVNSNSNSSGDLAALSAARSRGHPSSQPLELVVSRGPGPDFSEHEIRVASHAAVLLSQALASVRDRAAYSEARTALEESFRGMEEASEAVAVLVAERDRRAQHDEERMTDLRKRHDGEIATTVKDARRARREARDLRRQLEVVCGAVSAVGAACGVFLAGSGDGNDGGRVVLSDDAETGEVIAVVERAARSALRCSFARVIRGPSAEMEPKAEWGGEKEGHVVRKAASFSEPRLGEGISAPGATSGQHAQGDEEEAHAAAEPSGTGDETGVTERLHVSIPYYGSLADPLILYVHGTLNPPQRYGEIDTIVASTLAACLGTALQIFHEKEHVRVLTERDDGTAACTAAAEAEARERGERAVAGMRALIAAAQASKAQAQAEAATSRRAERQTVALQHLLSGLDRAGRADLPAVAATVEKLVSAAVPGCLGSAILTPRGDNGTGESRACFSPDPRAWARATSSRIRQRADGSGRLECGKAWARRVEEAAVKAYSTGTMRCVTTDFTADLSGERVGNVGGASRQSMVVCFSAVPAVLPLESERLIYDQEGSSRPAGSSGRVRTAQLQREELKSAAGSGAIGANVSTTCLLALVMCLDAKGGRACDFDDDERGSESAWAAVSPLTGATPETPPTRWPPLPEHVSSAMNAVVHAVGLALFATAISAQVHGIVQSNSFKRRRSGSRRARPVAIGTDGSSLSSPRREETRPEKSSREKELRTLHNRTAALAERVQTLEGRAASLRASEARSAAALARARADMGAVKSELQLVELERERERRKPLSARSIGNFGGEGVFYLSSARRGERGEGMTCALRPYWASDRSTAVGSVSEVGVSNLGGMSVPASPVERALLPEARLPGVKGSEMKLRGVGVTKAAMPEVVLERTGVSAVPPSSLAPSPLAGASSVALQNMASVHARLSDSLKRGGVR